MKKEDVKKLAELCRIKVSDDELTELTKDIDSILSYVSEISEVASEEMVPDLPAQAGAGAIRNVMRADEEPHEPGAYTETLLNAAPKRDKDYVAVKKILP